MKKYQNVWKSTLYYLKQGLNKDFVVHTQGVVKAMELILKKEKGNPDTLIPAAMLHDTGWSKVPAKYQGNTNRVNKLRGMQLHIKFAPEIIQKVLGELNFKNSVINEVVEIVVAHKFKKPRKLNKKILIDADQLSDCFKKQFYSDAKAYNSTPKRLYNFRIKDNKFYTKVAKEIFEREMKKRKNEFKNK